jgi:8-oxo-dGTP diphosphatase
VVRSGRVLLLRRAQDPWRHAWDVPGGFCEAAEHPMHAAERELAEEVGLAARATAYIGTWIDTYGPPDADGLQTHCATSAYLMELTDPDGAPQLQAEEVTAVDWFAWDDLPARLAFPDHARPMLAAATLLVAGAAPALPDRSW